MIWLTWRQFRTPALVTAALLLALAVGLALTWTSVTGMATAAGFTDCAGDSCLAAADVFLQSLDQSFAGELHTAATGVLILLPVLLGAFWGAPLVARELESGTYRMVFSQSVSRSRWLVVKLAAGGLAAALGAGLLSLVLSRWAQPIDAASADRLTPLVFGARGVVPIGYALLAFVAGVTIGLLLRRTVAAMAVTTLVVAGLQLAGPLVVRPLLADPVTTTVPLTFDGPYGMSWNDDSNELRVLVEPGVRGSWVLSNTTVTPAGAEFVGPVDPTVCGPRAVREKQTCKAWLLTQNLRQEVVHVPGTSFWTLQWQETGLMVLLAAALSGLSFWWIRRRLR